jgi:hypothetical protein
MSSEEKAMIWRSECEHGHPEWLFGLCPAGHRAGIQVRYFSLPEIKALLTEAKDIAGSSVLGAIQTREEDTLSYVDRIVTAAYRPIEDRVDALADAVPSEEHADASS